MDQIVNLTAFAVLALSGFYVIAVLVENVRTAGAVQRIADAESSLFREQVEQIRAARQFDRAKNELSWNGVRKFEVMRKAPENDQICSFYLKPHDQRPLPPFEPGQYLTFKLNMPGSRKPTVRCYSLSDSPQTEYFRVSIKRQVPPKDAAKANIDKSSSNFFHDHVEEGDILDVQAPNGDFFLDLTKQTPVVLIGGGIGITPVLSMLNTIVETGSNRETHFFLGVRNGVEHVFKDHLQKIANENPNVRLHICYSKPDEGDQEGVDYHHVARVGVDLFKEVLPSNNYEYYFCGPPPMMNSLFEGLKEWGVPEDHIHFEAFGPATVQRVKKEPEAAAGAAPAADISITFTRSEKTLAWNTDSGSLLDFAEENDIELDFGCRSGSCGSCMTAVMEGEVTYLKQPNADVEKGSCLTCISVPKGNLRLDA